MSILAFWKLVPVEVTKANKKSPVDHQEYVTFIERFLFKDYGPGALQQLQEWDHFLKSLMLSEDQLMYNFVFI